MGKRKSRQALNEILLFDCLGQHLVALCGVYVPLDATGKPQGQEKSVSFSGFVVVLDGTWFVITAGHVLGEKFGNFIKNRQIQLNHCSIADYFGKNAKTQMPTVISFDDIPKFHVDNRHLGLDIGVLLVARSSSFLATEQPNHVWLPYESRRRGDPGTAKLDGG